VLHHLGVYDAIAADGYTYEGMQIMNSRGFMIGTFFAGSKRAQGFPALRVRRSTLREVLLSEIDKRGVEIVYEKALKHLSEDGDVVKLVFADGAIITSGLVIGADDLRSTVRKAVAPDVQPYYNGFTAIYGLAEKEDLDQDTQNFPIPSMALGLNGSFAIIPVDPAGNRIGFVTGIVLPDRSTEEWKAFRKDNAGLRDLMTKTFANDNWPRAVQTLCHKTIHDEVLAWP
jgi:2-polyprenyl-6-methoxyphenol hydroxylase-like FAD-dependent oxidoreductase